MTTALWKTYDTRKPAGWSRTTTTIPTGTGIGSILVAGPVAVAAAIQYFTTINEPFTPAAPAPAM